MFWFCPTRLVDRASGNVGSVLPLAFFNVIHNVRSSRLQLPLLTPSLSPLVLAPPNYKRVCCSDWEHLYLRFPEWSALGIVSILTNHHISWFYGSTPQRLSLNRPACPWSSLKFIYCNSYPETSFCFTSYYLSWTSNFHISSWHYIYNSLHTFMFPSMRYNVNQMPYSTNVGSKYCCESLSKVCVEYRNPHHMLYLHVLQIIFTFQRASRRIFRDTSIKISPVVSSVSTMFTQILCFQLQNKIVNSEPYRISCLSYRHTTCRVLHISHI